MLNILERRIFLLSLTVLLITVYSCTPSKKVLYLNDLLPADSAILRTAQNTFERPIQKNDQLAIHVGGSNALDLVVLNSAALNTGGGGVVNASTGYLVEADGTITLPYIGKIKAEGSSRLQLESQLTELFKEYTKNPVVTVRYLNYTFSVLGEVTRPGRFNMSTERISIWEAIGMAGDITNIGKADNVLIVREENGRRDIGRINLLSKDVFKSPYYYLRTNDVLYVEPVKARFINRSGVPQYLAIVAVGLSLVLTVINISR